MRAQAKALPGRCLLCGRCCRVVGIDFTKRELRELARRERRRLRGGAIERHRGEVQRLLRDIRFIDRHFHRVSRARAAALNPVFRDSSYDGRRFYTCDRLGPDGRCQSHAERPYLCEGYPWYLGGPRPGALVCTPCGYQDDLGA